MKKLIVIVILSLVWFANYASANTFVNQWQGLSGSKLTAYSGSAISSNSTLTVLRFCRNYRYSYSREGSWHSPGVAGGASSNTITGSWNIQQNGNQYFLTYLTDQGQRGAFLIYLENSGRVNIGGASYAVQKGGAGC